MSTYVRVNGSGRMANQMSQLMFARSLQRLCDTEIEIEGVDLPDWRLRIPMSDSAPSPISLGSHLTRVKLVAAMIDRFRPPTIDIDSVIMRHANFSGDYSDLFPLEPGASFSDDELVIHLRLGDVGTMTHPYMGPLPIAHYKRLVEALRLTPVFVGELDDSEYCQALRRTFPGAKFLGGQSGYHDFQSLRRAKHIAIGISSYSWFASYLSNAVAIHVPVTGLLNPTIRPQVDLLPSNDPRYYFHGIATKAWNRRYDDPMGSDSDVFPLTRERVSRMRRVAVLRTAVKNVRVHAGAARRMMPRIF